MVVVGSWESIWEVTAGAAAATNIGGLVLDLSPPLEAGAFAIIGTAQNRTAGRHTGIGPAKDIAHQETGTPLVC